MKRSSSGTPDPLRAGLLAVIRERANQVRFAIGQVPQLCFFAPWFSHGEVHDEDLVIPMTVFEVVTSDDLNRFFEKYLPEANQVELNSAGATRFQMPFHYRDRFVDRTEIFLIEIFDHPLSTVISAS